jgi:glycosyltransferase A (GT-A) superfamily protein (DUF2064 family)
VSRNVLIVAKAPAPGRAKTRLVPPLTAEQAAALQEALLLDTLEACRAEAPVTAILHADPSDAPTLARLVGPDVPLVFQGRAGPRRRASPRLLSPTERRTSEAWIREGAHDN